MGIKILYQKKNMIKAGIVFLFLIYSSELFCFNKQASEIKKILIEKSGELNIKVDKYRKSIDINEAEKQKQEIRRDLKESIKKIIDYIIAPPLENVKETRDAIIFLVDKIDDLRKNYGEFLTIDEKEEIKEMSEKIRTIIQTGVSNEKLKKESVYSREERTVEESTGVDKLTYLKILIAEDRYREALEKINNMSTYSNEMELQLLKAECLDKLELYEEAAVEYSKILAKSYSEEIEVKLIKAYIKLEKKYKGKAKEELLRIIRETKDEYLLNSSEKVYSRIKNDEYWREFKPRIEAGVGIVFDDNVNLGSDTAGEILSDMGMTTSIKVENDYILNENIILHPGIKYTRKDYKENPSQNIESFMIGVVPIVKAEGLILSTPYNYYKLSGKTGITEINLIGAAVDYNLLDGVGVKPSFQYLLNNKINNYKSDIRVLSLEGYYKKKNELSLEIRYEFETPTEESIDESYRGNNSTIFIGSGVLKILESINIFGQSLIAVTNFDDIEPEQEVKRKESKFMGEIGVEKIEFYGLIKYRVSYKFTKNDSNVDIYNYSNNQISLNILSEF